jgi:hypothetical protein
MLIEMLNLDMFKTSLYEVREKLEYERNFQEIEERYKNFIKETGKIVEKHFPEYLEINEKITSNPELLGQILSKLNGKDEEELNKVLSFIVRNEIKTIINKIFDYRAKGINEKVSDDDKKAFQNIFIMETGTSTMLKLELLDDIYKSKVNPNYKNYLIKLTPNSFQQYGKLKHIKDLFNPVTYKKYKSLIDDIYPDLLKVYSGQDGAGEVFLIFFGCNTKKEGKGDVHFLYNGKDKLLEIKANKNDTSDGGHLTGSKGSEAWKSVDFLNVIKNICPIIENNKKVINKIENDIPYSFIDKNFKALFSLSKLIKREIKKHKEKYPNIQFKCLKDKDEYEIFQEILFAFVETHYPLLTKDKKKFKIIYDRLKSDWSIKNLKIYLKNPNKNTIKEVFIYPMVIFQLHYYARVSEFHYLMILNYDNGNFISFGFDNLQDSYNRLLHYIKGLRIKTADFKWTSGSSIRLGLNVKGYKSVFELN